MKVAFLADNLNQDNGWGVYAKNLIVNLQKHGLQPVVFVSRGRPNILFAKAYLFSYYDDSFKKIKAFLDYKKIQRYLKEVDLVHVLHEPYAYLGGLIKNKLKKPFFLTGHGTYLIKPLDNTRLLKLYQPAYQSADKIICVSQYTRNQLRQRLRLNNLTVIHNGVSINQFSGFKRARAKNPPQLLSVGGLKERKNQMFGLEVFRQLKPIFPEIKYNIIGTIDSADYFNKLQQFIKAYKLKDVSIMTNITVESLRKYYHESDIFLMPSKKVGCDIEGFGLVYLEAAASGLPAIGLQGSGASEAIKDGFSGFVVNDQNQAVDQIKSLLTKPDLYSQISQAALTWAKEHDWASLALNYLNLYERVVAEYQK